MPSSYWLSLTWIVSLVCAFWVGTWFSQNDPSKPMLVQAEQRPENSSILASVDTSQLRAIVREELSRQTRLLLDKDSAIKVQVHQLNQNQVESSNARISAASVIENGIADGIWSEEDVHALRQQLSQLSVKEAEDVLIPLFAAINEQRIVLDGPPF